MNRDDFIEALLKNGLIKVDAKKGEVHVIRGSRGVQIAPRKCGTECNGYLVAQFTHIGITKQVRLNRVVWFSINGKPKKGMVVGHKNNNKKDNRISNLYLTTGPQNTTDAARDGLLNGWSRQKKI